MSNIEEGMFLYIATSNNYKPLNLYKIGLTTDPRKRLSTYNTGCPPNINADIYYYKIFKTKAENRDDLYDYEEIVHNRFFTRRQFRVVANDSEWFYFTPEELPTVIEFIHSSTWFVSEVVLSEVQINPKKKQLKPYVSNSNIIKTNTKRLAILEELQRPIIDTIVDFVNSDEKAGYIIAPCGFGKTVVASKGIDGLSKVIICCPNNHIIQQWQNIIIHNNIFDKNDILTIGELGTTNTSKISSFLSRDTFCIITTYYSSYLLYDLINSNIDIFIFDEAHHQAGLVGDKDSEEGEGITRKLLSKTVELNIKRLSLTYTPKYITNNETKNSIYSMDDVEVFGDELANISLRTLINKGVLPDYKIWNLTDDKCQATGLRAKVEFIVNIWDSKEYYRGEERYTLRHLIIFTDTIESSKDIETYLKESLDSSTEIYRVEGGNRSNYEIIEKFKKASRSIIINCKVLNEGVDIPEANSVAILYPKYSKIEITQMILRAGRWHEGKDNFHILFPITLEEDLGNMTEVLVSLASIDEVLRDELVYLSRKIAEPKEALIDKISGLDDTLPEHIMIECIDGYDTSKLSSSFKSAISRIRDFKDYYKIQKICRDNKITTSVDYQKLRESNSNLLEDPRKKGETWFDFLNSSVTKMKLDEFIKNISEKNILDSSAYDKYFRDNNELPSIQNIIDGYFGLEQTNFSIILDKANNSKTPSRRR